MKSLSSLTLVEIITIVLFLLVVLLPYQIPHSIGFFIDSALGMIVLFIATLALFYYCHPILGVLFLFVSYDLLRRSSSALPQSPMIQYTPSQDMKDKQMERMNPHPITSLEEEIVAMKAPVDGSKMAVSFISEPSTFKPILQPI